MEAYKKSFLIQSHKHATNNKKALEQSENCVCFYCFEMYDPREILNDENTFYADESTAFCAKCGIDSVLASASGLPIDDDVFVDLMGFVWFNGYASGHRYARNYKELAKRFKNYIIDDEPMSHK
jgi:hypothetical protein